MTAYSIDQVLEQIGVKIASGGDREISCHCPFHEDRHPSFSINADTGLWICYQCGRSGTLTMLVEEVGQKDPKTFLREVRFQQVQAPREEEEPEPEIPRAMIFARFETFKLPPFWARNERNLRLSEVEKYKLRWDKGWIIPIWEPRVADPSAALWGWQFKRLDSVFNFPKGVNKSQTLFGLRELPADRVAVLVESPLDVVRLASAGVPAVSSYGALVSRVQQRLLVESVNRVVLALDSDEEGQRQTDKIYPQLSRLIPTDTVDMPAGCKDPGDLNEKQVARVFGDLPGRTPRVSRRSSRDDDVSGISPTRSRSGTR